MNLYSVTILLSLTLLIPTVYAAEDKSPACDCAAQAQHKPMVITEEQRAKMNTIIAENNQAMASTNLQLNALNEQIEVLVQTDHLDEKTLNQLTQRQAELLARRMKDRALTNYKIYNLLTPEQKIHFKSMHQFWKFKTEDTHTLNTY